MFKLNENYENNRNILRCDYNRYSQSERSTLNTAESQVLIIIPTDDSVFSLLNSYLELNFDVLHAAASNRYADNNDIRLVNMGLIALFSEYNLTTSSGKHLESIEHGQFACLVYKLLTTARGCHDMSVGFDRSCDRRQRERTNNKNIRGKYFVRIYLTDIFGFAQHQLKGTYGLGYTILLTGNNVSAVLNKYNAINNAKFKIKSIHWYVPHYMSSIAQQAILFKQIQSKKPTELQYPEILFL